MQDNINAIRAENRNNKQVVTSTLVDRALLQAKRINARANGRLCANKKARINEEALDTGCLHSAIYLIRQAARARLLN